MAATWSAGSRWLRWDPHLHAPGTLRNDQFGKNSWPAYFKQIEAADPPPAALGITDYFSMRTYKEVLRRRAEEGALAHVPLIFANIELRLTQETRRGAPINLHLLVSPDDPEHVARMEEQLMLLKFTYDGESHPCSDEALRRLGRRHARNPALPDDAALVSGANQFKAELSAVRDLFADRWCLENVLVAVAGGGDGLAGLSNDASYHAYRQDLGRFAHIIFSGNPSDRKYWLADHPNFQDEGQSPKPCLHGSDAHSINTVLVPSAAGTGDARLCWIRGDATFESLRQTLIEPDRRVFIGPAPPEGPSPSRVIRSLRVDNAGWLLTPEIELNDGLVTIIGSRGSGKTALADLVALAADADASTFREDADSASFIAKAFPLLSDVAATITWADGATQTRGLPDPIDPTGEPRVRYLSQKFVEKLCSPAVADGVHGEPLGVEIEHVVFSAIPEENRLQCSSFDELRTVRLSACIAQENEERALIRERTISIAEQLDLDRSLAARKNRLKEATRARAAVEAELVKLPTKANDETVKAHAVESEKLNALKAAIALQQRAELSARELVATFDRHVRSADVAWETLRTRYDAMLSAAEWNMLRLRPGAAATQVLQRLKATVAQRVENLRAHGTLEETGTELGLEFLERKVKSLTDALGLDQANATRRSDLARGLLSAKQAEKKAVEDVAVATQADGSVKQLSRDRSAAYRRIFEVFLEHEDTLRSLYEPLQSLLSSEKALKKISFAVERVADLTGWAERGEDLFDLRSEPFCGEGSLAKEARDLSRTWKIGTPAEVMAAMDTFVPKVRTQKRKQGVSALDVGEWLFATDHVAVRYAIRYDGLELRQLSPGTRGIVLLTLYLALDRWDDRPLVIDQPEENLDPRSVFEELVPFFQAAAKRRQIIMVTHNPNLVVNTDSDQVVIADSRRRDPSQLPDVTYIAGGLEDTAIRDHVCRVLEGGLEAFERRQRQYKTVSG